MAEGKAIKGFGYRVARHMAPGLIGLTLAAGIFGFTQATTSYDAPSYKGYSDASISAVYNQEAFDQLVYNQPATVILFARHDRSGAIAEAATLAAARDLHMTVRIIHHDQSLVAYPTSRAFGVSDGSPQTSAQIAPH